MSSSKRQSTLAYFVLLQSFVNIIANLDVDALPCVSVQATAALLCCIAITIRAQQTNELDLRPWPTCIETIEYITATADDD